MSDIWDSVISTNANLPAQFRQEPSPAVIPLAVVQSDLILSPAPAKSPAPRFAVVSLNRDGRDPIALSRRGQAEGFEFGKSLGSVGLLGVPAGSFSVPTSAGHRAAFFA